MDRQAELRAPDIGTRATASERAPRRGLDRLPQPRRLLPQARQPEVSCMLILRLPAARRL
eukprot:15447311-Alexandrium_andersonii.AAC.1